METNQNKPQENKPKKSNRLLLLGLGLGTIVIGSLGIWYFTTSNKKPDENIPDLPADSQTQDNPDKPKVPETPKNNSAPKNNLPVKPPGKTKIEPKDQPKDFAPIKAGSKGEAVKKIQQALIKAFGKSILPAWGADGVYGKELMVALNSKGLPATIDEAAFNKILALTPVSSPNQLTPESKINIDIATKIWHSSKLKKLDSLLTELKRIKDVQHYSQVNELYKTIKVVPDTRKTIVNATLSSFDDETSKQFIRSEFMRMGLKYDSNTEKWSLSGHDEKQIMTTRETTICNIEGLSLDVSEQTILGVELSRGRRNTRFRTLDNQILYVPTKHVRYV